MTCEGGRRAAQAERKRERGLSRLHQARNSCRISVGAVPPMRHCMGPPTDTFLDDPATPSARTHEGAYTQLESGPQGGAAAFQIPIRSRWGNTGTAQTGPLAWVRA